MIVAIRVDGNVDIGVGHVMRCLTLAKRLAGFDISCIFYARNISENLNHLIAQSFEVVLLNGIDHEFKPIDDYSHWLSVRESFDAMEFIAKTKDRNIEFVIVDHYGIGFAWEKRVHSTYGKLMVLDDLANRKHKADLLIDQSIGRTETSYLGLVPSNCRVLAGPKFSLLRDEFNFLQKSSSKQYQILINFGGADKDNFTMHVVDLLAQSLSINNYSIKIVVGKEYPFKHELIQKIKYLKAQITLVESPKNIAKEIAECAIAIGAGGVSLLERSVLGVPSIIYAVAENQMHICEEYDKRNLGRVITKGEEGECKKLNSVIQQFLNTETLYFRSQLNRELVDFRGVDRVVAQLLKDFNFVTSHEATIEDITFI